MLSVVRRFLSHPAVDSLASESLEQRSLLSANITLNTATGVVTIEGSSFADQAYVDVVETNTLRVILNTSEIERFPLAQVQRVDFLGRAGDDLFLNRTTLRCKALGGDGNDQLTGGYATGQLSGDDGDDALVGRGAADLLYGGYGNDQIWGGGGSDQIFGSDGNDTLYGGAGDDFIYGLTGNDTIWGEAGRDTIQGYSGSDLLYGGDGADILKGGENVDAIRGGAGNDYLYGDDGNDLLRGEGDADRLFGGNGDDSLYGGAASIADRLMGNSGKDRYLLEGFDTIGDWSAVDAKLFFRRGNVNWTPGEIEVVDRGFQALYQLTKNNVLLRDSLDLTGIEFYKYSSLGGGAVSINHLSGRIVNGRATYTRYIDLRDWNENDANFNQIMISTVVHEMGHNWDSAKEIAAVAPGLQGVWSSFLKLSGWTSTAPANVSAYNRSYDGRWWYLKSAEFARDYGRANPCEDWSTVWERLASPQAGPVGQNLQSKLNAVRTLFAGLAKLA